MSTLPQRRNKSTEQTASRAKLNSMINVDDPEENFDDEVDETPAAPPKGRKGKPVPQPESDNEADETPVAPPKGRKGKPVPQPDSDDEVDETPAAPPKGRKGKPVPQPDPDDEVDETPVSKGRNKKPMMKVEDEEDDEDEDSNYTAKQVRKAVNKPSKIHFDANSKADKKTSTRKPKDGPSKITSVFDKTTSSEKYVEEDCKTFDLTPIRDEVNAILENINIIFKKVVSPKKENVTDSDDDDVPIVQKRGKKTVREVEIDDEKDDEQVETPLVSKRGKKQQQTSMKDE